MIGKRRETKADRIRILTNQLEHERNQVKELRLVTQTQDIMIRTMRELTDAVLVSACQEYGERREEDGKLLGYRLEVLRLEPSKVGELYEMRLEVVNGSWVIGVTPKENAGYKPGGEKNGD